MKTSGLFRLGFITSWVLIITLSVTACSFLHQKSQVLQSTATPSTQPGYFSPIEGVTRIDLTNYVATFGESLGNTPIFMQEGFLTVQNWGWYDPFNYLYFPSQPKPHVFFKLFNKFSLGLAPLISIIDIFPSGNKLLVEKLSRVKNSIPDLLFSYTKSLEILDLTTGDLVPLISNFEDYCFWEISYISWDKSEGNFILVCPSYNAYGNSVILFNIQNRTIIEIHGYYQEIFNRTQKDSHLQAAIAHDSQNVALFDEKSQKLAVVPINFFMPFGDKPDPPRLFLISNVLPGLTWSVDDQWIYFIKNPDYHSNAGYGYALENNWELDRIQPYTGIQETVLYSSDLKTAFSRNKITEWKPLSGWRLSQNEREMFIYIWNFEKRAPIYYFIEWK